MGGTTRFPLARAEAWANDLARMLRRRTERVEVAGSIRRRKPDVGDVEIVFVPRFEVRPVEAQAREPAEPPPPSAQASLFGAPPPPAAPAPKPVQVNLVWDFMDQLVAAGVIAAPTKAGERFRSYPGDHERPQIDLFAVAPPAQWGAIFTIRTGSGDYSKRLMGALRKRGLRCQDGAVWEGAQVLPTPEEEDFFEACGLPWVRPEDRQ